MMGNWYVIRKSIALLRPNSAREVIGLTTMFGGNLGLAELMAPAADKAVAILCDEPDAPKATEIHICFECYTGKLGILAGLLEAASKRDE